MDLLSKPKDNPVNPDSRDSEGFTLLMRASQLPSAECEFVNNKNNTLSVIKHLLDSGVDPEARSPDGMTAFEMAVQCNNWPAILALLPRCEVKIGENVLLPGQLYLHELTKHKDICDEKLRLLTNNLLAHGLNINELDSDGYSPLTLAARHKNWNYVVVLLEYGADASVNVDCLSLFYFIIFHHRDIPRSIFTSLLDAMQARGVNFNSQHRKGRTILFEYKVCFGNDNYYDMFNLPVDRGANPLLCDHDGHSLLRFSLDVNDDYGLMFLKFLVKIGVTTHQPALTEAAKTRTASASSMPSPTQAAFEVEDVQAFRILIESGASSNRELFELSAQLEETLVSNRTRVKTEMLAILKQAATQPRCLKSLCRLTVSHALGCGTRREEKVTCLPVPQRLQQYILFDDILSEELQTPEEIVHHNLCRGNRRMFGQPSTEYVCGHSLLMSRFGQHNELQIADTEE